MVQEELRVLHLHPKEAKEQTVGPLPPTVTHFLQWDHIYSYEDMPPNSVTPWTKCIQTTTYIQAKHTQEVKINNFYSLKITFTNRSYFLKFTLKTILRIVPSKTHLYTCSAHTPVWLSDFNSLWCWWINRGRSVPNFSSFFFKLISILIMNYNNLKD